MFSILIYAGINRQLRDKLHVHNVVFARDFRGNIDDILVVRCLMTHHYIFTSHL